MPKKREQTLKLLVETFGHIWLERDKDLAPGQYPLLLVWPALEYLNPLTLITCTTTSATAYSPTSSATSSKHLQEQDLCPTFLQPDQDPGHRHCWSFPCQCPMSQSPSPLQPRCQIIKSKFPKTLYNLLFKTISLFPEIGLCGLWTASLPINHEMIVGRPPVDPCQLPSLCCDSVQPFFYIYIIFHIYYVTLSNRSLKHPDPRVFLHRLNSLS